MIIDVICNYPKHLVMGATALAGALIFAVVSVIRKKKEDKKFKFNTTKIMDTIWQSAVAGAAAGVALPCAWEGLLIAFVGGIGIDAVANKLQISKTQVFNIIHWIAKTIEKKK